MKMSFVRFIGVVLVLIIMSSCGSPVPSLGGTPAGQTVPSAEAPPSEGMQNTPPRDSSLVGISVPSAPTGWVAAVQWSAETNAERLGLDYRLLASADEAEQAGHIDELIAMGCGIIVLFPHNDTLSDAAQKIMDSGITLVNFDRTLGNVMPDYYVAGDNRQMGVVGAEFINEKLGGEGKVIVVNIPSYGEIFSSRVSGFRDTVAEKYPGIEITNEYAAELGSAEAGAAITETILAENPSGSIDAIYSTDDEVSSGIIQALAASGRAGEIKAITGGGGAQSYFSLMDQYPDMAISTQTYDPYMMASCIELASGLLNGESFPQTTIIPARNLTKDNYQQWLDDNNITADAPY